MVWTFADVMDLSTQEVSSLRRVDILAPHFKHPYQEQFFLFTLSFSTASDCSLLTLSRLSRFCTKKTMTTPRFGIEPTPEEFEALQCRFCFMPDHGV